jgi:hypothetical protein
MALTPELRQYYEARFAMTGEQGWRDLMTDVQGIIDATDKLSSVTETTSLDFRRGELSILRWLLSLESVSENAYKELLNEDSE